eukprot:s215_g22.t1
MLHDALAEDRSEFVEIMNIPEVRTWLAAQELPVQDPNILFNLLDDGDAELTAEELVKGVERLKGTAKGIDLASFIAEYRSFASKGLWACPSAQRGPVSEYQHRPLRRRKAILKEGPALS